jgi:ankyrin repeat protein
MFSYIKKQITLLYAKQNPKYIFQSVISGNIETIKILVENGLDINTKIEKIYSLLFIAASFNHYEICEYLIENGADINSISNSNNLLTIITVNPLLFTSTDVERPIMDELSSDVNSTNKENPYLKIVKLLVENGCNVNYVNLSGITPLINAVKNINYEICKYLLENGADINYTRPPFYSALYSACLLCGENYNIYEWTDYQIKKMNEIYKICVLLVENGADLLEKDHEGMPIISRYWLNYNEPFRNEAENTNKYKIYRIRLKIKTYLEDKIREREMLKTCFKRAQILDDDSYTDEEDNEEENEEVEIDEE